MSKKHDPMRDPLKNVRGLGSAKEGVQHWWVQRVTAIALVPLALVMQIGSASRRERVCQYVYISVVAVSLKTTPHTVELRSVLTCAITHVTTTTDHKQKRQR